MQKNSLNKSILTLALPAIVANITTPLLSLVDIAIVGHLGSASFVAAIAVGGTLFNMLYWLFGFLRFGTSGLTAQAYGRGNREERDAILRQSLTIALIIGAALILLHRPLGKIAMKLINPAPEAEHLALVYFRILIYGAPAVMMQYALTGWFVGNQNTRAPMWISLAVNVINIAASLMLVFVFNMGFRGVALGSLIAQWSGIIIAFVFVGKFPRAAAKSANLRRFFAINTDIFLRTLCLIAVTVWFTRLGASQGTLVLAVNTLLLQLFTLFSYFMDGFAFAAEALCGKYVGARNFAGLRRSIARIELWSASIAVIFTLVYALGGNDFLRFLTDDEAIIRAAAPYRLWAAAIPIAGFLAFAWDGIAIGITHTRMMLLSMALATALFFALNATFASLSNHALWLAFITYLLARGLLLKFLTTRLCQNKDNL